MELSLSLSVSVRYLERGIRQPKNCYASIRVYTFKHNNSGQLAALNCTSQTGSPENLRSGGPAVQLTSGQLPLALRRRIWRISASPPSVAVSSADARVVEPAAVAVGIALTLALLR